MKERFGRFEGAVEPAGLYVLSGFPLPLLPVRGQKPEGTSLDHPERGKDDLPIPNFFGEKVSLPDVKLLPRLGGQGDPGLFLDLYAVHTNSILYIMSDPQSMPQRFMGRPFKSRERGIKVE